MRLGIHLTAQDFLRTGHGKFGHLLAQALFCTVDFLLDFSLGTGQQAVTFEADRRHDFHGASIHHCAQPAARRSAASVVSMSASVVDQLHSATRSTAPGTSISISWNGPNTTFAGQSYGLRPTR